MGQPSTKFNRGRDTPIQMGAMHRAFLAGLEAFRYDLLVDRIARKLADRGLLLKKSERAKLRRELEQQDSPNLKFRRGRKSKNHKDALSFTDTELAEIKKELNHALETETIASIADDLAINIRRDLDRKWKAEQKRRHREYRKFSKRLYRCWSKPLSQLEQLIVVATELGASVNLKLRAQHPCPNPFTVDVQTRLHARACQIARETLTLLSAGFADGAMARWRALHEVAVVSLFIGQDEDLAERYRRHETVESLRVGRQYREHTARLGLEPLTDAEMEVLEADVAALKKRFGQDYSKSYGWAVEKLQCVGKRVTFNQIEAAAALGHLRPYYQLASHGVHANPKGAFFRLGLIDQAEILLAGPSNLGLADAGQNTAISLGQITTELGTLNPNLDELVLMKVVLTLVDEIPKRFVRVQRALEGGAAIVAGKRDDP